MCSTVSFTKVSFQYYAFQWRNVQSQELILLLRSIKLLQFSQFTPWRRNRVTACYSHHLIILLQSYNKYKVRDRWIQLLLGSRTIFSLGSGSTEPVFLWKPFKIWRTFATRKTHPVRLWVEPWFSSTFTGCPPNTHTHRLYCVGIP